MRWWKRLVRSERGAIITVPVILAYTGMSLFLGGLTLVDAVDNRDTVMTDVIPLRAQRDRLEELLKTAEGVRAEVLRTQISQMDKVIRESTNDQNDKVVTAGGQFALSAVLTPFSATRLSVGALQTVVNIDGLRQTLEDGYQLASNYVSDMYSVPGVGAQPIDAQSAEIIFNRYKGEAISGDAAGTLEPLAAEQTALAQTQQHIVEVNKAKGGEIKPEGLAWGAVEQVQARTDPENPELEPFGDFLLKPDDAAALQNGDQPQILGLIQTPDGTRKVTVTATPEGFQAQIPGVEQTIEVSGDFVASAEHLAALFSDEQRSYSCSGVFTVVLGEGDTETVNVAWMLTIDGREGPATSTWVYDDSDTETFAGLWEGNRYTFDDGFSTVSLNVNDETAHGTLQSIEGDYGTIDCVRFTR